MRLKQSGIALILILAFFGLADSIYLTESKLSGTPLQCGVTALSGCNIVAQSEYSDIFGIPLSEFGILFYSVVFILVALELVMPNRLLRRAIQGISLVGVLSSLYFMFLQLFVINAICIYCSISAVITLLILILASFIEPLRKRAVPFQSSLQNKSQNLRMPPSP